jgi:hypothetical protein
LNEGKYESHCRHQIWNEKKIKGEIEKKKDKFKTNLNKNIKIMITRSNRQEKIKGE